MAAVASGNGIIIFFFFYEKPRFFQIFYRFFSAEFAVHSQIFFGAVNHFALIVDNGHNGQIVALADFVVGGIVRRGNF